MYYTAADVIEYLLTTTGGGAQDSEHRALRAAVHHGYRDVMNARDWLWHVSEGYVEMQAGVVRYDLPADVKSIDTLAPQDRTSLTAYITPTEWKRLEVSGLTFGQPVYWTVMRDVDATAFDRWEIRIAGMPRAGERLYFTYRRQPTPITLMGYEMPCRSGTVTTNGTTTAVVGTDTAFPACGGAVIRFGTQDALPEGLAGINPYKEQHRIVSRSSDTGLVLQSTPSAFTDVRYMISNLLDMSQPMYTALLTGAEMWLARLTGKSIESAVAMYERDLRLAFEADVVAPLSGQRTNVTAPSPRLAGWASPSQPDTGG